MNSFYFLDLENLMLEWLTAKTTLKYFVYIYPFVGWLAFFNRRGKEQTRKRLVIPNILWNLNLWVEHLWERFAQIFGFNS